MVKKTATTKQAALSVAGQQHEPVQEFLNQEPIRSHLLSLLREKTGNYLELKLLLELLESKQPISGNDLQKVSKHKGAISDSSKKLGIFLADVFSESIEPLKAKGIKICIPRSKEKGGLNVGYHFACFDTQANKYLDGPATGRLFENLWDEFIRNELHRKLTEEAQNGLKGKLGGRDDYQILDMEVGTIRQASQNTEFDELEESERPKIYDHNRTWKFTDIDALFKQGLSLYVLSVDAGCGKTTFLRYLQAKLLENGNYTPIFIDASRLEKWNVENSFGFVERLTEYVNLPISADRVKSFLERFLKGDIVLLIDGLDQIKTGGSQYEYLADQVLSLMGKNVIIASRPSAVINLENDRKYVFLRMGPFDTKTQKEYFGNTFGRARQLSQKAPHLIAIPMLANMVRMLIEDKQDKGINSRTELYERFVDHIFMEYKHGKTKLSSDERTQIRRSLRKVAYDALTQNKPNIQIIPLDFCYDGIHFAGARHGEFLAKSGLVNLIVDGSERKNKDSLFFTHQSFQEYLAAEYVAEDDSRIQKVLSEKWNPKWKEVLKFLAGSKGEAIIKAIYSEQDNVIHSKLFLSAELVPDVNSISGDLKNGIWQDIETLLSDPMFAQDAEKYLLYANQTKAINRIAAKLNDSNVDIVVEAINNLIEIKDKVDISVVTRLAALLDNDREEIVNTTLHALIEMNDKVDTPIIEKMITKLECKHKYIASIKIPEALEEMKDSIDDKLIGMVSVRLQCEDKNVVYATLRTLEALSEKVNKNVVTKLAAKLDDEQEEIVLAAINALTKVKDKVDDSVISKIASKIQKTDLMLEVLTEVLKSLNVEKKLAQKIFEEYRSERFSGNLGKELDDALGDGVYETIINKFHCKEDIMIASINFLGKLQTVDESIIKKIVPLLDRIEPCYRKAAVRALVNWGCDRNDDIRKKLIAQLEYDFIVVTETLVSLSRWHKIDTQVLEKIVANLESRDSEIVRLSGVFLRARKDAIDESIIEKIAAIIHNSNELRYAENARRLLMDLGEDIVPDNIVQRISDALESKDRKSVHRALFALQAFNEKIDGPIARKVAGKLNDEHLDIVCETLNTLACWKNKIDEGIVKEIVVKLEHKNSKVVWAALDVLQATEHIHDYHVAKKIAVTLLHDDEDVRNKALYALINMKHSVDMPIMELVIARLEDANAHIALETVPYALGEMKDKIDDFFINMISSKLQHEDKNVVYAALRALEKLADKGGKEIVDAVAAKLSDTDEKIVIAAIEALGAMKDNVDAHKNCNNIIKEIADKLYNRNKNVVLAAICALEKYADKIDADIIVNIVGKLKYPNEQIVREAIDALGKMQNKIDTAIVNKLTEMRIASSYQVLKELYRNGRLEHLTN